MHLIKEYFILEKQNACIGLLEDGSIANMCFSPPRAHIASRGVYNFFGNILPNNSLEFLLAGEDIIYAIDWDVRVIPIPERFLAQMFILGLETIAHSRVKNV